MKKIGVMAGLVVVLFAGCEDQAVIDQRIAESRRERTVAYEQKMQRDYEQKMERERLEREQVEGRRIEFETKKKELIQNGNGTIRDKSAQEVKKLVDSWKEESWRWIDGTEFLSVDNFYKVFGEPSRKQLLSSEFEPASYYFLYECKDWPDPQKLYHC
jgi:hypothetical protein